MRQRVRGGGGEAALPVESIGGRLKRKERFLLSDQSRIFHRKIGEGHRDGIQLLVWIGNAEITLQQLQQLRNAFRCVLCALGLAVWNDYANRRLANLAGVDDV